MRSSDLLVRLPDRDPRLEPAARPQAVQLDQSPAVGKRPPRDGEGGEIRLRLEVGLRDGGREHEPRLRSVGRDCASVAERGLELGPMLAPEIELVAEVERDATLIDPATAERRRIDIVPAQALAGRAGVEIERGVQRRSRRVRERARGAYAGLGGTQARAALERPPHERVQLRIAEHRPPVLARPVAARRVLIEGERLRRERVRLALDARVTRASGERKRQYKRQDRRSRHPSESAGGRFRDGPSAHQHRLPLHRGHARPRHRRPAGARRHERCRHPPADLRSHCARRHRGPASEWRHGTRQRAIGSHPMDPHHGAALCARHRARRVPGRRGSASESLLTDAARGRGLRRCRGARAACAAPRPRLQRVRAR